MRRLNRGTQTREEETRHPLVPADAGIVQKTYFADHVRV